MVMIPKNGFIGCYNHTRRRSQNLPSTHCMPLHCNPPGNGMMNPFGQISAIFLGRSLPQKIPFLLAPLINYCVPVDRLCTLSLALVVSFVGPLEILFVLSTRLLPNFSHIETVAQTLFGSLMSLCIIAVWPTLA